ncbi:MAG: hypothetical protein K0R00_60 [Herbinix sp.]|jgi:hypothetical protein|nr:hypothetical protein [Herbinix sp.]
MADNIKVTSMMIKRALAQYHVKDFFATECKNGPTYNPVGNGLLIFDAIAIAKSWSNPDITIYEVKVSRGDFLQDGKWQCYVPYCHEFYFVVPKGMVKKEELPESVGLKYYDPVTGAIRTVKKAVYKKIELDPNLLMYIIMNKLDSDRIPFCSSKQEFAESYLADIGKKKYIGRSLGTKMARDMQEMQKQIDQLYNAKEQIELLNVILDVLRKYGVSTWPSSRIPEKLEEHFNKNCPEELDLIANSVNRLQTEILKMQERYNKKEV